MTLNPEISPSENPQVELALGDTIKGVADEATTKEHDETTPEHEKTIKNTGGFKEAVNAGRLEEAEDFLNKIVADLKKEEKDREYPNYDEAWLDRVSVELFRAYRKAEDWVAAERLVKLANLPQDIENRRKKLAEDKARAANN